MNISEIINHEKVIIKYQPIMSTHNKNFLGLEALVRGLDNDIEISPMELFQEARNNHLVLSLDKLCIKKSIKGFQDFFHFNQKSILFINIDATVMNYYINSDYIETLLKESHIKTSNIVLEINELKTISLKKMKDFSVKYKKLGCLIALDDVGAGESNLERIPLIMPDIMKIDKNLIQDLGKSFYCKQVVASIIELASNLGALVVIEGVETAKDINHVAAFGAHLIQGYYLGKPSLLSTEFFISIFENKTKITELIYQYNKVIHHERKKNHNYMNLIANEMKSKIELITLNKYKKLILETICKYDVVESVYILNMEGKLLTDTIFNEDVALNVNDLLYTPCLENDTVELAEYFTKIKYGGYDFWISNEYISMASGHKCYTYSSSFKKDMNTTYIICIDFDSHKTSQKLTHYNKEVNYE